MFLLERKISVSIAAVIALVVAMPAAYAQTSNERHVREGRWQGGGQSQPPPQNPREAQRPYGKRSEGGEAQRGQRLSPEERHQLRRDIKEAGREIYLPRR